MKSEINWIITFIVMGFSFSEANYTFTYEMAAKCKEHISRNGYKYDTFYRVDPGSRKLEPGVAFEMHLAILAASNGHVLLSFKQKPKIYESVYEFVIGGGGNKFSELRGTRGRNAKVSVQTVGILSSVEYKAFYIRVSEDGLVELGLEGEPLPLISYNDYDSFPINYFSFASWSGEQAKFLYDCPVAGENVTTNSEIVDRPMSPSEKLKKSLLSNRSSNLAPAPVVVVNLYLKVRTINYDAFESKLDTGIGVVMSWTDTNMVWDPIQNNFTKSLKFKPGEIWKPVFHIQNSDTISFLDSGSSDPIYFQFSGEASYVLQTMVTTWCDDRTTILSNWPRDEYQCIIVLTPWALHEKIDVKLMKGSEFSATFLERMQVISTEWEILYITQNVTRNNEVSDIDYLRNDMVLITIGIRRRPGAYNVVFYTPLLVIIAFLLISFWTKSLTLARVWFYAGMSVTICMGLSYVDFLVPSHKLPSIVVLYVYVLFGALFALLTQVIMIHPSVQASFKGVRAQSFITNRCIRFLCCLPSMKICNIYETVNDTYSIPNDDDSGVVVPRTNLQELEVEDPTGTGEKEEFAEVVDKFMFSVYTVVFAILLGYHY